MINLGVYKGAGTLLCKIRIGDSHNAISKIGRQFLVQINNKTILAAETEKRFINRTMPVFNKITEIQAQACKDTPESQVSKKHMNLLDGILKSIRTNLKPVETFSLKLKPDEIEENRPADICGFEGFKKMHAKYAETIENLYQKSTDMLNTRLSKEVWGSKDIFNCLGSVRSEMADIKGSLETVTGILEKSGSLIDIVHKCMNNKLAMQSGEAIKKLVNDFSMVKSFLSELAQITYPLYAMDNTCQKCAGFPATFFFSSSTYLDVQYDYENIVHHLITAADLESKVIKSLLAYQLTASFKTQNERSTS